MQIVAMWFAVCQFLHLHSSAPVQTTRLHAGVSAEETQQFRCIQMGTCLIRLPPHLRQQIHLFSDNGHSGFNLLAMRSDQLIFFILQLLVQQVAVLLQPLLLCIAAVLKVLLSDVAVSAAGGAPHRRP